MKDIKQLLDKMHRPVIKQGIFGAFDGSIVRYTKDNFGFIPFFVNEIASDTIIMSEKDGNIIYLKNYNNEYLPLMNVKNGILNKTSVNRPGFKKVAGLNYDANHFIVIHDTGDIQFDAAGWNRIINTDDRGVSWHFTIDDNDVYQHIPLDEVAWHAGDGSRTPLDRYYNKTYNKDGCLGGGNRNGIGIETCITKATDYNVVMHTTAKLVAKMMINLDLDMSRIKQHNDFSGKNCPQSMRRLDLYEDFLKLIECELEFSTEYRDYEIIYKSFNEDILSNTGKILKEYEGIVSYQVTIKHKDDEMNLTYKTKIEKRKE